MSVQRWSVTTWVSAQGPTSELVSRWKSEVYTVQCIVYTVHCTVYSVYWGTPLTAQDGNRRTNVSVEHMHLCDVHNPREIWSFFRSCCAFSIRTCCAFSIRSCCCRLLLLVVCYRFQLFFFQKSIQAFEIARAAAFRLLGFVEFVKPVTAIGKWQLGFAYPKGGEKR